MKYVLNKWNGKKRRWCWMLKGEKENVDNEIGVEIIVRGY